MGNIYLNDQMENVRWHLIEFLDNLYRNKFGEDRSNDLTNACNNKPIVWGKNAEFLLWLLVDVKLCIEEPKFIEVNYFKDSIGKKLELYYADSLEEVNRLYTKIGEGKINFNQIEDANLSNEAKYILGQLYLNNVAGGFCTFPISEASIIPNKVVYGNKTVDDVTEDLYKQLQEDLKINWRDFLED